MGVDQPQVMFGEVMHGRLFPKKNHFRYKIYYVSLPLNGLNDMPLAYNAKSRLSFYDKDHGLCDGSDLESWARKILNDYDFNEDVNTITLVTMPRVMGYVFNPVSFWLCRNAQHELKAVLCEVHNTFGERHTYLCAHPDGQIIMANDKLLGQKIFHVSPMLEREGSYEFCFSITDENFSIGIDYYNAENKKQLVTTLKGRFKPMSQNILSQAFWRYPLVTIKAIILIHWQALKLLLKGVRYISKPEQKLERVSSTENITKSSSL